jgi:hypothetical protein
VPHSSRPSGEGLRFVGAPPTPPYYGTPADVTDLSVHGGLGFAYEALRTNTVSLLGVRLDCGDGYDFVPGQPLPEAEVRDDEFVWRECAWLAV